MAVFPSLSNLIFVGNFPELDTNEALAGFEGSAAPIIGTELRGNDTNANVVSFDYDDANSDGILAADHISGGETVTVGGVSSVIDKIVTVSVDLTNGAGAVTNVNAMGYQLANGDFYLGDLLNNLEGRNVISLQIAGISNTTDSHAIATYQGGGINDLDSFNFLACFDAGTLILTEQGERPVDELNIGDLVQTVDAGLQPIRWISRSRHKWAAHPHKDKPILFSAGSLGAGLPCRDLRVSPQHRMLVPDADHPGGAMVPAKKLVDLKGVRQMRGRRHAEYIHLFFDQHQVVIAEGAPSESYYPGPWALQTLAPSDRDTLVFLCPQIVSPEGYPLARSILKNRAVKQRARKGTLLWDAASLATAGITGLGAELPKPTHFARRHNFDATAAQHVRIVASDGALVPPTGAIASVPGMDRSASHS